MTGPEMYRLCVIKAALRLHCVGMRHSRLTGAQMLEMATAYTGRPYKRGQYEIAHADLEKIINGLKMERSDDGQ